MQTWINNNYPNPNELGTILNITESETYEFLKSLKIKKIKVNKVKIEDTMKNKIDIDFNTKFVNLSD